jgi:hypothetical protein
MKKVVFYLFVVVVSVFAAGFWLKKSFVHESRQKAVSLVQTAVSSTGSMLLDEMQPVSLAFIGEMIGTVSVVRQHVTSSVEMGFALQQGDELVVDKDSEATLVWAGYGKTVIGSNSRLQIERLEAVEDMSLTVRLSLSAGRVWTRLERLLEIGSSFEVTVDDVVATVRGTSFGVSMNNDEVDVQVTDHAVEMKRVKRSMKDNRMVEEQMGEVMMVEQGKKMKILRAKKGKESVMPKLEGMRKEEMEDRFLKKGHRGLPREILELRGKKMSREAMRALMQQLSASSTLME